MASSTGARPSRPCGAETAPSPAGALLSCRTCGAPLAYTDGTLLYIGRVSFHRAVTMTCGCGRVRKWAPTPPIR
jgi:hypothetical protein